MKKKFLRRKFGKSDVEHLALAIHKEFHLDEDFSGEGWTPYKKYKGDAVVEQARQIAFYVAYNYYIDSKEKGLGTVYN